MGNGQSKRPYQFFISREGELKKAIEQFFFLHYPTSRKVDDKYISRTNAEDRADIIRDLGKECFEEVLEECPHLDYLKDPDIPFCFLFVYNTFLEIYNCCHETMTWTDIQSYAIIRKIDFKQIEIDYILKCYNWANEQISKMRNEEDSYVSTEEAEGQI